MDDDGGVLLGLAHRGDWDVRDVALYKFWPRRVQHTRGAIGLQKLRILYVAFSFYEPCICFELAHSEESFSAV